MDANWKKRADLESLFFLVIRAVSLVLLAVAVYLALK